MKFLFVPIDGLIGDIAYVQARPDRYVIKPSGASQNYRKDVGDRWVEDRDRLHNWGCLRE